MEGGKVIDQKKAAGALPTPAAVSNELTKASVSKTARSDNNLLKVYTTLQAKFAMTGRELTRCHRASDGRVSFVVRYRGESRHFTHLHDVEAHLSAIGDRS